MPPTVRTLGRYLALRRDRELGPALVAIEAILPELEEPVSPSTMALLVAIPRGHCAAIARELLGARRAKRSRVEWRRLIAIVDVLRQAPPSVRRPLARAARREEPEPEVSSIALRLVSNE